MRDDRAARIDGCPHEFDAPTGQCRQCGAHYTTIIERYQTKALAALLAAEAALAYVADAQRGLTYVADAQRGLADVQAVVARLITPP
jgi:hypothetical protein